MNATKEAPIEKCDHRIAMTCSPKKKAQKPINFKKKLTRLYLELKMRAH